MFSFILWILVFPSLFYNLLGIIIIVVLFFAYRFHQSCKSERISMVRKSKMIIQRRLIAKSDKLHDTHACLAVILALCCLSQTTLCDKQDAIILQPVHSLSKGLIGMVAEGKQLSLDFSTADLVRSAGLLIWRARFPMRMPSGVVQKSQDFLNRVSARVNETDISNLGRKTMKRLGDDMNAIMDALLLQVRNSPDGIYTDYLQTQVDGQPLEEAVYNVGLQLKAYQTDLIHYRDLASMLLGIPVMPHVASTINSAVAQVPNFQTLKDITQNLVQNSNRTINGATNMAKSVVNQGTAITSNIPGVSTMTNVISLPLSTIGSTTDTIRGVLPFGRGQSSTT